MLGFVWSGRRDISGVGATSFVKSVVLTTTLLDKQKQIEQGAAWINKHSCLKAFSLWHPLWGVFGWDPSCRGGPGWVWEVLWGEPTVPFAGLDWTTSAVNSYYGWSLVAETCEAITDTNRTKLHRLLAVKYCSEPFPNIVQKFLGKSRLSSLN